MAKSFTLTERAVRALRRNDQSQRVEPYYPSAPRGYAQPPNMHSMRMETTLGIVRPDTIPKAINGVALGQGLVEIVVLQEDGSLKFAEIKVRAYNPFAHPQGVEQLVGLIRDWRTGRWIIIFGAARAELIMFEAQDAFTKSDDQFSAKILASFHGFSPIPNYWSATTYDFIKNPPKPSGGYLFEADAGACGFAEYHDADTVNPGSPEGYWCTGIECTVAA